MTKTAALSTKPPEFFALGQDVIAEQIKEVCNAQVWTFAKRWECHISQTVDTDNWDNYTNSVHNGELLAVGTQRVLLTGSLVTYFTFDIYIDTDATNADVICGAELNCDVSVTGVVTFTFTGSLGSDTAQTSHTDANNQTELTDTIDLALVTNGAEWVTVVVQAQRTVGSNPIRFRTIRIEEQEITSFPDPGDCDVVDSGDPVLDGGDQVTACT